MCAHTFAVKFVGMSVHHIVLRHHSVCMAFCVCRCVVGVCIDRRSGTGTGPALKDTVESLVKLWSNSLIDTPLECADIENKRMNVTATIGRCCQSREGALFSLVQLCGDGQGRAVIEN